MYLLDTNIISEMMRVKPNEHVVSWLRNIPSDQLYTTHITEAELRYGAEKSDQEIDRKRRLQKIDHILNVSLKGRVLPYDAYAAQGFATVAMNRYRTHNAGKASIDTHIAAIAQAHNLAVVTRNVKHFEGAGIEIINPFEP